MRKTLLRNAVTASKNGNFKNFLNYSTTIFPFFHTSKHNAPLKEAATENCYQQNQITEEANLLLTHLNSSTTSEFTSNVLFYISGYIVAKLVKELSCSSCKSCLLSHYSTPTPEYDYSEAYGFHPSPCTVWWNVQRNCLKQMFVNKPRQKIPTESKLKQKMIVAVCIATLLWETLQRHSRNERTKQLKASTHQSHLVQK